MSTRKPKPVQYRRRRESKTNYAKRLKTLLSKKSRLVVRITNQKVIGQVIDFTIQGDKVGVAVDSFSLKKLGWNYSCKNISAAYLTGLLLGKKALTAGVKEAILDTGLVSPLIKGKIYAFLKGAIDSGLIIAHDGNIFPSDDRISGKHVQDYAIQLKEKDSVAYEKQFAQYLKNKALPEKMVEVFNKVRNQITS